jgi:hypothetical protein
MNDESPFHRPNVREGYPLDKEEKAAVEQARKELAESSRERTPDDDDAPGDE